MAIKSRDKVARYYLAIKLFVCHCTIDAVAIIPRDAIAESGSCSPSICNFMHCAKHTSTCVVNYVTVCADNICNKNSSGDEIANVNFLRRYRTYVLQNTKKENLLRLTN